MSRRLGNDKEARQKRLVNYLPLSDAGGTRAAEAPVQVIAKEKAEDQTGLPPLPPLLLRRLLRRFSRLRQLCRRVKHKLFFFGVHIGDHFTFGNRSLNDQL